MKKLMKALLILCVAVVTAGFVVYAVKKGQQCLFSLYRKLKDRLDVKENPLFFDL